VRLIAQRIEPLDDGCDGLDGEVEIRIAAPEVAGRLRPLLQADNGRGSKVRLVLPTALAGEVATIALPPGFAARYAAMLDIERLEGVLGVREVEGPIAGH
jgi:hypothetical protein